MLTCKEFLAELSDYLDQEVSAEERALLEEHFRNCPSCAVIIDTTKQTIEVYRHQVPVKVPEALKQRLQAALEKKAAERQGGG